MKNTSLSLAHLALISIVVAAMAWWISFKLYTNISFDDALITYRYAQNLASGQGFVFNEGERVLGTTTPLLTLMLSLIGKSFGVHLIPLASSTIMTLLGFLTGILNYAIFRRLQYSQLTSLVAMALFYANGLILLTSIGGMETPMVLFFMALSAYFLLQNRYTLALSACSLLVLTRIDGVIWSFLIFISIIIKNKKILYKPIIISGLILLPWIIFSLVYFGTIIPHSVIAKQTIGGISSSSSLSLGTFIGFSRWFVTSASNDHHLLFVFWMVVLPIGALKWLHDREKRSFKRILVLYPILYVAFLYFGRAPHFIWYQAPALWCCVLLCAIGIEELASVCSDHIRYPITTVPLKFLVTILIVLSYSFLQNSGTLTQIYKNERNEIHTRRALGLWLHDNTPSESTVLMEAIGYQGFYSKRIIIDLAGLVSPSVVKLRKNSSSNAEAFYKIISHFKPNYIVLRSFEFDENEHFHGGLLFENHTQKQYFGEHYKELKRFSAPYPEIWGKLSYLTLFGPIETNCRNRSDK